MKTAREFYLEQDLGYIEDYMIEFAKMHVQEALKEACCNVDFDMISTTDHSEELAVVNENSILNAYPLTNIK
jgi:hypothetical protein